MRCLSRSGSRRRRESDLLGSEMDHRDGGEEGEAKARQSQKEREELWARQWRDERQRHPQLAALLDAVDSGGCAEQLIQALEAARLASGSNPGWIDQRMLWPDVLALSGFGLGSVIVSGKPWPASAMDVAAAKGNVEAMKTLARAGARIDQADATGRSPVSRAAAFGQAGSLAWLLSQGASPDAPQSALEGSVLGIHSGMGPLAMAVDAGQIECAKLLLAAGADPDKRDLSGDTPIFNACYARQLWAVELLSPVANLAALGAKGQTVGELFGEAFQKDEEGLALWMAFKRGQALQEARKISSAALTGPARPKGRI